ncbi:MAG: S8 family serine peptidase [Planctomycetota bacterium]
MNLLIVLATAVLAPAATRLGSGVHVPNEIIVKFRQNAAASIEKALAESTTESNLVLLDSLEKLNQKYRIKDAQVLFKNFRKHREEKKALMKKDKALLNGKEKRVLARLKRAPKGARIPELDRIYKLRIKLEAGQSIQAAVAAYDNNPDVEYAELNYIFSIDETPDDPLYPLQWCLNNTGQMYPESGKYKTPPGIPDCDIDAPEAWDICTGSPEIIVAVVDTGVDYRHRDLDDNMWINIGEIAGNGVDDDGNGYVDDIYGYDFSNNDGDPYDDNGHGTHCAGTIAAEGDNGLDIAGVCWNARIMALKFLGSDGTGSLSGAINTFYYAVENGADVTSNSWSGRAYSSAMKEAIDYAHSQGVIMVASAGNNYFTSPKFPAYYEHVISVAATNSDDEKALFSNYGNWVDIAAPGVDILSLRAEDTSRGTVHDKYTTVMSGTSMACPHVAGACALLLSANPLLTSDEVYDILIGTVDPISPGICIADGRLNLYSAIATAVPSRGYISLNRDYYMCSNVVSVFLIDYDLRDRDTQAVNVSTTGGDSETMLLTKYAHRPGIFTGMIPTSSGEPNVEDNTLQLSHGEIITATYEDANDGTGNPATVMDNALVDCVPPVIFNVLVEKTGSVGARITFETDEPTIGQVRCDLACGEPYAFVGEDTVLARTHTVNISGLSRETSYYFIVDAVDAADNQTTDNNKNACYSFATAEHEVVHVPGEFPTIQAAINQIWEGDTVIVADGNYTGSGNWDIDFKGKAITVRSENGPENCIIDCNSSEEEPHRGFNFHSSEGPDSVVRGFTIVNGYAPDGEGGAIKCVNSSPTIENCIFSRNSAFNSGGGVHNYNSSPTLTNCTFSDNLVTNDIDSSGGGMSNYYYSNPTLINCTFTRNSAYSYSDNTLGGGMYNYVSEPTLTNCAFIENSGGLGGGMCNCYSNPTLTNCTFSRNLVHLGGGGMRNLASSVVLTNCIFNGNMSDSYGGGGGMDNDSSTLTLTNCVFSGNSVPERGGGMQNNYRDIVVLTNCTFQENLASAGGGMYCRDYTNATLSNCTFAGNSAINANALVYYTSPDQTHPSDLWVTNCILWDGPDQIQTNDNSLITITYSNVQGGWAGPGGNNINIDPDFEDATNPDPNLRDYRLHLGSPCIDAGDSNSVPSDTHDLDGDGNTTELLPWDLDKQPRFTDGDCNDIKVVDMGAYEFAYTYIGDFGGQCGVDMVDYAILTLSWLHEDGDVEWNPDCDISIPADNSVNMLDLAVFIKYWLAGK